MRKFIIICICCLTLFMALYGATYKESFNLIAEIVTSIETVTDKVSTIILPGSFSSSFADIGIYDKIVGSTTIGNQLSRLQFNQQRDTLYANGYTIEKKSFIDATSISSGYCLRWSADRDGVISDVYCSPTTDIKYGNNYYMYMVNEGFKQKFYYDAVSFARGQIAEIRIGTIKSVEESITVEQLFNLWFTN